jgi:hypothetical protein
MSTESQTGVVTFSVGHPNAGARVEKGAPGAYRLARYRTDDGAIELKLQGYYLSWQGLKVCYEWRDIPTVDLTETQP